jgi:hypothetical protein
VQDEIAKTTGGRAFYSDNALKEALNEAVEDGGNYYTLTYAPSNREYDGSLRKIRVDLASKGYHLAYRRSYYATAPDASRLSVVSQTSGSHEPQPAPIRAIGDSLYANMQHGAPLAHQIIFRAHVRSSGVPVQATAEQMANLAQQPAYFSVRRKKHPEKILPPVPLQTYLVDYAVVAQTKTGTEGHAVRPPALELAVAAYDAEGQMLNGVVENTDTSLPSRPGETAKAGLFRAEQRIDAPLNTASIRIAVRDISTDRLGAMEIPLPLAPEPVQAAPPASSAPAASATNPPTVKPN